MTVSVLVVDDSGFFRKRLTEILNASRDIKVVGTASNGREAVELAEKLKPDVITMDYEMPVMDGYQATREIREWEQSNGQQPTPIIALTANTMPNTESECIASGMNDYLAKPIRKQSLQTTLGRWINV